jgi:hypothetical protein
MDPSLSEAKKEQTHELREDDKVGKALLGDYAVERGPASLLVRGAERTRPK